MPATFAALLALVLPFAHAVAAAEPDPVLTLHSGNQIVEYRRSELLKRPDVTRIHVEHDPSYGEKSRDYAHAVPLRPLFARIDIPSGATLQFECLDGFSAPISKERLLNENGAVPFLAIEAPGDDWPKAGSKDAGPFYLIWMNPEKSRIGTEEWPFALAGFTVKASIEASYPKIVPAQDVPANSPIRRGFKVFTKNCFACHTLNLQGQSQMGPDLNVPMNPTEYFSESNLKKLIRNPQNLRHWPESKMKGFGEQEISATELSDLLTYLKHMAKHGRN